MLQLFLLHVSEHEYIIKGTQKLAGNTEAMNQIGFYRNKGKT